VRADLLVAAAEAFGARGYEAVSLRDVAKRAQTTPAMIRYYFGDKRGLFVALLDETLAGVLARVREALAARGEARAGARARRGTGSSALEAFFDIAHETIGATPWIPQLVLREVLSDGARFRDRFIDGYAGPMSQLLRGVLREEIEAGRLRPDLDVDLSFTSLIALAIFPFIAQPVLERTLGLSFDAAFRARLAAHTKRFVLDGVHA
jgi:AcrR family transcriptional regulator